MRLSPRRDEGGCLPVVDAVQLRRRDKGKPVRVTALWIDHNKTKITARAFGALPPLPTLMFCMYISPLFLCFCGTASFKSIQEMMKWSTFEESTIFTHQYCRMTSIKRWLCSGLSSLSLSLSLLLLLRRLHDVKDAVGYYQHEFWSVFESLDLWHILSTFV